MSDIGVRPGRYELLVFLQRNVSNEETAKRPIRGRPYESSDDDEEEAEQASKAEI